MVLIYVGVGLIFDQAGGLRKRRNPEPGAVFDLEVKAADIARALNRREIEGEHRGAGDAEELAIHALDHRGDVLARAFAVAPGLDEGEHDAIVRTDIKP